MKKLIIIGCVLFFCALIVVKVMAFTSVGPQSITATAGSCTLKTIYSGTSTPVNGDDVTYLLSWTSNSSGAVKVVLPTMSGTIVEAVTKPGLAAPTALYKIDLLDQDGIDLFLGAMHNRLATAAQMTLFTGGTNPSPVEVNEAPTLVISGAGAAKTGTLRFIVIK